MADLIPISFNPGLTGVAGTDTVGELTVGYNPGSWSQSPGGLRWWNTPDLSLGYVIAHSSPITEQPTQPGISPTGGQVGFWRTKVKTDQAFIELAEYAGRNFDIPPTFNTAQEAKNWLNTNGFWTSWGVITDGLIIQLDANDTDSYPGSGSTVYDISGNFDHTLSGASFTTLSGVKCFNCTTGGNRVVVNGVGPTLPTSGYTYITWARLEPISPAGFRTLLYTNSPKYTPITIPDNSNTLGYWDTTFRSSGYDAVSSVGIWVQYAIVGDSSSQTFYINGSQVGNTISYGAGGRTHWGWGNNDGAQQPWGYVANLYLYNRKLSLSEINQQYIFLKDRF